MIRIGPAGLGPVKTALDTLERYHNQGFRACEIAFTYSVYIKNMADAKAIGQKARELDISLSIHAPYFVNLNSSDIKKREATKARILDCCRVGYWLGAKTVVFHPGYYGPDRKASYEVVREGVSALLAAIKSEGWNIKLGPETMGKINVFGSLEEIHHLVGDTGSSCCIDFAHLLAREKKVDYKKVIELFPQKEWHVHFSGIEYGEKGEKRHKTTSKEEWGTLLRNLPKYKEITLINESPTLLEDCIEGLKIAKKLGWKTS